MLRRGRASQQETTVEESLLQRIYSAPLEHTSDYVERSTRGPMGAIGKILTVILTSLLVAASVWSTRALTRPNAVDEDTQRLQTQLSERRAHNRQLEDRNRQLGAEIRKLSSGVSRSVRIDPGTEVAAAAVPVSGPGIVVVLADSAQSSQSASDEARVQDRDLQLLVNSLWSAGAEAIAINGIRLGPQTAVRSAAGNILINLEPVKTPYSVAAIGPTKQLLAAVSGGETAKYFADLNGTYGIGVSTVINEKLSMPAASAQP